MMMNSLRTCILALCLSAGLSACSTPTDIADEIAVGPNPDQITLKVNGVPYVFDVQNSSNYFGIHTGASADGNSIWMNLGYGDVGTYAWTGQASFMETRPTAAWNGSYSIPDYGFLRITQKTSEYVAGTFAFTTTNPTTHDTLRVTDGTFHIHFISTD
jgi:hypothetical protein